MKWLAQVTILICKRYQQVYHASVYALVHLVQLVLQSIVNKSINLQHQDSWYSLVHFS